MVFRLKRISNILLDEKDNWFLWVPVLFGIGVLIYFYLPCEPKLELILIFFTFFIILYFALRKFRKIIVAFVIILAGFCNIFIKANIQNTNIIPYEQKFFKVNAKIEEIKPTEKGIRILFNEVKFNKTSLKKLPQKIRVTFKTKLNDAEVGDLVEFNAILSHPKEPIIPGGYEFARQAYFEKIGAVGYAVSNIKIIQKNTNDLFNGGFIENIRFNLQKIILSSSGSSFGGVITALMIGEYASLDKDILENLRISGLAHILAVSGLHVSLIASIIFFSSRLLLNCSSFISLEFNVKKFSAFVTIFGTFVYLLLTGAHIAAIRAFIMTLIFLLAIIFDKIQVGMRSIAIAAIIILIIYPEYLVFPSFQMSFAAVLALISVYDLLIKNGFKIGNYNIFYRFIFYFLTIIVSSIIAGIATAPFIAYHFNQISKYSVLANILVLPAVSFYIMPLILAGLVLYPFGLLTYILPLLNYGIDYIIKVAAFVANLPLSYNLVPRMSDLSLGFIIMGGLWFLLWQTRWRYYGFLSIIIGMILIFVSKQPDIIIDKDSREFVLLENNEVIFSNSIRSKMKKETLLKYYGKKKGKQLSNYLGKHFECSGERCSFFKKNKKILIDYSDNLIFTKCNVEADLIFLPNSDDISEECLNKKIIYKNLLKQYGSHIVYLGNKIKIITVSEKLGFRLWNIKN